MAGSAVSRVVIGRVMHRRRHPAENRFVYPVFYLLLNTDELDTLGSWIFGVNRRRLLGFHFADYGDGRDPRLWVREQLKQNGIEDCSGPIWVQTFPRVFGYVFNPVSFWYCTRPDGSVGAILAEVNNTFGDKHCYVLTPDPDSGRYEDIHADKRMYVSPFYPVSGGYRFNFNVDLNQPRVRIDYYDDGRLQLNTAIWGCARPFSNSSLLSALTRQPMLTLAVIARIHWQALRLWLKGTKFYTHPSSSAEEASR